MYLFWKINETPESEPSLDNKDVRQEVVHAWKMIRARELARKEAERMAESARKSGGTLREAFADLANTKVIDPPPFTMLTEGFVPQASSPNSIRLSNVEGVSMAGLDFMRAVFNLEKGQIGIAMNAPQTVTYVIQLVNYTPPQDALWKIFLAEDYSKYSSAATLDLNASRRAWLDSLKTYAGLKWEAKPEQPRSDSAPDSMPEE